MGITCKRVPDSHGQLSRNLKGISAVFQRKFCIRRYRPVIYKFLSLWNGIYCILRAFWVAQKGHWQWDKISYFLLGVGGSKRPIWVNASPLNVLKYNICTGCAVKCLSFESCISNSWNPRWRSIPQDCITLYQCICTFRYRKGEYHGNLGHCYNYCVRGNCIYNHCSCHFSSVSCHNFIGNIYFNWRYTINYGILQIVATRTHI